MTKSTQNAPVTGRSWARSFAGATIASLTASALVATLAFPGPALAQRRGEPRLQVSYPTDGRMTCDQLTAEVARMEEIAGISAQSAQNAQTQSAVVGGAANVAVTAALHTGVLGAVPGLGLFANMASGAAQRNAEARAREEAERIRIAEQRRTLLSGIYQGRQCGVPVAPPAPAPAAPVSAAVEAAPAVAPPVEAATTPEDPAPATGD